MRNSALAWRDWGVDTDLAGLSYAQRIPAHVSQPIISPQSSSFDPEWLSNVDSRLNELAELGRDWDSRGSAAVTLDAVRFARLILLQVLRRNSKSPCIVPLGHGGVQLSWETPDLEVDVEVKAPNKAEVYVLDKRSNQESEWVSDSDFVKLGQVLAPISESSSRGATWCHPILNATRAEGSFRTITQRYWIRTSSLGVPTQKRFSTGR